MNQRIPVKGYVHASEDVEKQFDAMMSTYLDSWSFPAQPSNAVPAQPTNSPTERFPNIQQQPDTSQQLQKLTDTADMSEHARALSSFVACPGSDAAIQGNQAGLFNQEDGDLFGLELEAPPDMGAATGQGSVLSTISSAEIPGSVGPQTGKEGDRKQKILEKNRRAQKRFREKQKAKMVDMEVTLQELQSTMHKTAQETTCLKRQNESLLKALELRQSQIEALSEVAKVDPDGSNEPDLAQQVCSAAGALSSQLESGLTLETCRAMSPTSAISYWRKYVERLTSVLVEAEMPSAPETCRASLRQAATHASKFSHVLAIVNPHAIKILMNSNLETGEFAPDSSHTQGDEFWTDTIDAISLTEDQKDKILYLASMLVRSIKSCHSQREVLSRNLTQLLPQTCGNGTSGNVGSSCAAMDTMSELRRNFQSEHIAWTTFVAGVVANILSHQQFARLCSRCYPYFPRTFQIARHLAKGKDILELTGLPGFLLPVASKTDAHAEGASHAPKEMEGEQDQGTRTASGEASDARDGGSPGGCGSRKSPRINALSVPQPKASDDQ